MNILKYIFRKAYFDAFDEGYEKGIEIGFEMGKQAATPVFMLFSKVESKEKDIKLNEAWEKFLKDNDLK